MGLAGAVDPGELQGVGMEESQIEIARAAAEAGGHGNAVFQTGDATALPFDDNSFDVAHCHALLTHVPNTQAALAEAKRVLKPGGILAARELIGASTFFEPDPEDIGGAWAIFSRLLEANGGHPQMGKELKRVFLEAGLSDIRAGASSRASSRQRTSPSSTALPAVGSSPPRPSARPPSTGWLLRSSSTAGGACWSSGGIHPGAFSAIAWGHAIAHKP